MNKTQLLNQAAGMVIEMISEIKEEERGKRPGWDEYFMVAAILASSRSSCKHVRAGSVIVQNKRIMGTGYNGTPPGIANCLEVGCRKEAKGLKYENSLNAGFCVGVHSEINALGHLSSLKDRGFTLYTTIFPCYSCIKNLLAYGVERIVFKREYSKEETEKSLNLLKESKVIIEKLDISPERIIDIILNDKEVYFDAFSKEEKIKLKEILKDLKI